MHERVVIYEGCKEAREKKQKDERLASGSGGTHQSLLKWQIIFVRTERVPSGNPMPTMLRLPWVSKPPRQEVAFDSKFSALCTKPQASPVHYKTRKGVKHLSDNVHVRSHGATHLWPWGGGVPTLTRHFVFSKSLGRKAIKYIRYLIFRCLCSPLYLFLKTKGGWLSWGL